MKELYNKRGLLKGVKAYAIEPSLDPVRLETQGSVIKRKGKHLFLVTAIHEGIEFEISFTEDALEGFLNAIDDHIQQDTKFSEAGRTYTRIFGWEPWD